MGMERVKMKSLRKHLVAGLCTTGLLAACDGELAPREEPLALSISALTGTSCGNPDAPTPGTDPFVDAPTVTVGVRAFDDATRTWETLKKVTKQIRPGVGLKLSKVPEGPDREVIVVAQGATAKWYGRYTGLDVKRNSDNVADIVLTKMGGVSCLPTPTGIQNTIFPAAVNLGDGRVLVVGGFTEVSSAGASTRLTGASSQAFLFDSRTGQTEALPSMGANAGRAGAAAVYLEETNKVVIIGGMTELQLDTTQPFPFVYDPDKGRDDYVVFDVATKTFTTGTERMKAKRGFPRVAEMTDGTVLITGGGKWPIDPAGADQIDCDMFDPLDNDNQGGLLDTTLLRSFYWRAGHSLTFLSESTEGLATWLIWGGTTPDRSLGHPAEIYRQSSRQRDNVNGTFVEVAITGEVPPFTYFHETTRLSGGRFLVTGGSRYEGGKLQAPRDDEAWLLTYSAEPRPVLQTQRIVGLGSGRVFHTALSNDLAHVSVIGGWNPLDSTANLIKTFDLATTGWTSEDGAAAQTTGRGGAAGLLTPGGAMLLFGGESSGNVNAGTTRMAAEIYTPATSPVP